MSHSWAIGPACRNYIGRVLTPGATILELGSGEGTGWLIADGFRLISVEHDSNWVGHYASTYIHAPIVDGWYDSDVLRCNLPTAYDLLLVDGPPSYIGRTGILQHMDLFVRWDVPVIVDDVHKPAEKHLLYELAQHTGRQVGVEVDGNKQFGALL